jgi:hypothetical protein
MVHRYVNVQLHTPIGVERGRALEAALASLETQLKMFESWAEEHRRQQEQSGERARSEDDADGKIIA